MGDCRYCGKPAGFLRSQHKLCFDLHKQGEREIISLVRKASLAGSGYKKLAASIEKLADSSHIDDDALQQLIIKGWEGAVEESFDDGVLSVKEEHALVSIMKHFTLSQDDVNDNGAFEKIVKGAILREVLEGKIPQKIKVDVHVPFNFQKGEQLIWLFQDVEYYVSRNKTSYVGGNQGVSIRVARGLYYRTGSFKGERVQTTEILHADTGLLGITNKHIYFAGPLERFRVKYEKIMAFDPFSDGIGIQRDALTAKPQSFVTGDGWFTYNLVVNAARL